MFDMRYHIASLVAVFLALTVGLLLGSLIADKDVVAREQERLVDSIRVDVGKINEENVNLKSRLRELEDFQGQALPISIRGRLIGQKVAIVTLADDQDALVGEIGRVMEMAGATAMPVHVNLAGLDFSDKDLVARLGRTFNATAAAGGDFERLFWTRFCAELADNEPSALTDELIAAKLVQVDTAGLPFDNIVVIAPAGRKAGNRDALFLESLVQLGRVRVVGVETVDAKPSRVAAYKLRNVSTVDNIETVPGKIALVYLLENRTLTAHYGAKSTADKLLP